jgi:hypothetical protein
VPGYDHAVPPGHFADSSQAAKCPQHRAYNISDRILHAERVLFGHAFREFVPSYDRSPSGRSFGLRDIWQQAMANADSDAFQVDLAVGVVTRPEYFRAWAILFSPFGRLN